MARCSEPTAGSSPWSCSWTWRGRSRSCAAGSWTKHGGAPTPLPPLARPGCRHVHGGSKPLAATACPGACVEQRFLYQPGPHPGLTSILLPYIYFTSLTVSTVQGSV
eukprot:EG_transcript_38966